LDYKNLLIFLTKLTTIITSFTPFYSKKDIVLADINSLLLVFGSPYFWQKLGKTWLKSTEFWRAVSFVSILKYLPALHKKN